MAWDDEMPTILRNLVFDISATPLYTDDQLNTLILVASISLVAEVSFVNAYTISVSDGTLSPDPTATSTRDNAFVNLACLKSATRLIAAEIRDLTRQGIEIQDDTSRIKLGRDPRALALMKDTFLKDYQDAMYAYKTGGNDGLGESIVSPYKYWSNWSNLGMAGMYDGYPADRYARGTLGGFY